MRRGFSARGRGKTTLDFERAVPDYDESDLRAGIALAQQGVDPGLYHDRWEPLTRGSQKETQAAIEEILGLSRETFRASCFLAQGDGAAFTEAVPARRKAILADVLGLDSWERLLEACRVDKRQAERESAELAGRISLLEESGELPDLLAARCEGLREQVAEHIAANQEAQDALTVATEQVAAIERAEQTYRTRHAEVMAAQARLAGKQAVIDRAAMAKVDAVEVQKALDDAGDPRAKVAGLEERQAAMDAQAERRREQESIRDRYLADAEDARRQVETLTVERSRVEQELRRLADQAAAINDPATIPHCPTCEQELRGEAFQTALARVREARADAEARIAAYTGRIQVQAEHEASRRSAAEAVQIPDAPDRDEYEALVHEIQVAREAELRVAGLRRDLAALEAQIAEATPELTAEVVRLADEKVGAQEALTEIEEPEPGELENARAEVLTAKARSEGTASALTESRAALVRAETALEQAQKIAQELTDARVHRDELLGELDLLALLERAYGRDGIPALIVEASAIPQIETEASRILAELGTSYRVELRTQKPDKAGERLLDTLDVVVIGDAGERPFESFSGGERSRLNVALRIALARLLAHRRGAESRLLVLDEVEYLDLPGQMALAGVLQELAQTEFDKVICVSHADALREFFDTTLTVEKVDGRSRIAA